MKQTIGGDAVSVLQILSCPGLRLMDDIVYLEMPGLRCKWMCYFRFKRRIDVHHSYRPESWVSKVDTIQCHIGDKETEECFRV